jgi:hypothetical protein
MSANNGMSNAEENGDAADKPVFTVVHTIGHSTGSFEDLIIILQS